MEELSTEEISRTEDLLSEDESIRNRGKFIYTYDVIAENCVEPFSIWPLPNEDTLRVIGGEVAYNDIPYEDQNEVEKGMLFEDMRHVIKKHISSKSMLCEVRNYEYCIQNQCPIFGFGDSKVGDKIGLCKEFKIVFEKG